MKITDVSYFAGAGITNGHYWYHESLRLVLGDDKYELFSRNAQTSEYRLSSFGYEQGSGPLFNSLVRREAKKIVKGSKFVGETDHMFYFFEGGSFEFALMLEIIIEHNSSLVWFNFHNSRIWEQISSDTKKSAQVREVLSDDEVKKRVIFSAESPELATRISEAFEIDCTLYPLFTTLPEQVGNKYMTSLNWADRRVDLFIVVGDAEMKLEVRDYVDALRRASDFKLQIHVHWSGREFDSAPLGGVIECSQSFGEQTPYEYFSLLSDTKYVLLLYNPENYRLRASGRVEDIIFCGGVPIVPKNTAVENQNGRALPTFSESQDVISILHKKEFKSFNVIDTEEAVRIFRTKLLEKESHRPNTDIPADKFQTIRLPSPMVHKRRVDKMSVWRIRLRAPEVLVSIPRKVFRMLRN